MLLFKLRFNVQDIAEEGFTLPAVLRGNSVINRDPPIPFEERNEQ